MLHVGVLQRIDKHSLFLGRAFVELVDHLGDLRHQLARRADDDRRSPLVRHRKHAAFLFHPLAGVGPGGVVRGGIGIKRTAEAAKASAIEAKALLVLVGIRAALALVRK